MSENQTEKQKPPEFELPRGEAFRRGLERRHQRGNAWRIFYYFSIFVAILALVTLFLNVINDAFGSVATVETVPESELVGEGQTLADLNSDELANLLLEYQPGRLLVLLRDNLSRVPNDEFTDSALSDVIPGGTYPDGIEPTTTIQEIRDLEDANIIWAQLLADNASTTQLRSLVVAEIIDRQVLKSWKLIDAIFNFEAVQEEAATDPDLQGAELTRFFSWLDSEFLTTPMSSVPAQAGIRTAILGSMYMMVIVIIFVLPVGVGSAIYLEEYAQGNIFDVFALRVQQFFNTNPAVRWLPGWVKGIVFALTNINALIDTNVRNLAGVPSIIYGMLGLAIFVRGLFLPFASGLFVGFNVNEPTDQRVVNIINDEVADAQLILSEDDAFAGVTSDSIIAAERADDLFNTFKRLGTPSVANQGALSNDRLLREVITALNDDGDVNAIVAEVEAIVQRETGDEFSTLEFNMMLADIDDEESLAQLDTLLIDATGIATGEVFALASALDRINSFNVNGRTLVSGALTLGLLILPIIIINSQEALRAVPFAIREGSYGLGATKWQTISRNVLPSAVPGILTGTILAVSRAIGETAPLIVVGASTFLLTDPEGPFSQFTVLPIQIFNWTARPQEQFRNIAAAAIIVLLVLVVAMNAVAIILRNRYSQRN